MFHSIPEYFVGVMGSGTLRFFSLTSEKKHLTPCAISVPTVQ